MGKFHKTLQDAKKALQRDKLKEFYKIVNRHCGDHIEASSEKILTRLHRHIEAYNTSLAWIAATHGDFDKAEAGRRLLAAMHALEQIKKDISELVKKEHIRIK